MLYKHQPTTVLCAFIRSSIGDIAVMTQMKKVSTNVLWWIRNDLRVHDNNTLLEAVKAVKRNGCGGIVPVFCFDSRQCGKDAVTYNYEIPRLSSNRAVFLSEAVWDLKNRYVIGQVCIEKFILSKLLSYYLSVQFKDQRRWRITTVKQYIIC